MQLRRYASMHVLLPCLRLRLKALDNALMQTAKAQRRLSRLSEAMYLSRSGLHGSDPHVWLVVHLQCLVQFGFHASLSGPEVINFTR